MKIRLTRRGEIVRDILQTIAFVSCLTLIVFIPVIIDWII